MIYVVLITCVALEVSIVLLAIIVIAMLVYPAVMKFEVHYRNWKYKKWIRKSNKDYEEYQQQKRKEELQKELHRKEMEEYPLFFWKESIV